MLQQHNNADSEGDGGSEFIEGIQVLLVFLVRDDLTIICFDPLLLLVILPRLSDKTLPLTIPINNRHLLMTENGKKKNSKILGKSDVKNKIKF